MTTRARLERIRDRGLDVLVGCIGLEASRAVREVVLFVDEELAEEAAERRGYGARLLDELALRRQHNPPEDTDQT